MAPVLVRDICSGVDTPCVSISDAGKRFGVASRVLTRTYLDQPRQAKGHHFRSEGSAYWEPPAGFVFLADQIETSAAVTQDRGVKSTPHAGPAKYYESVASIGKMVDEVDRRTLTDKIKSGEVYLGHVWTHVSLVDMGTWDTVPGKVPHAPPIAVNVGVKANKKKVEMYALDLATGEVEALANKERAADFGNVNSRTIQSTLLDKPRQAYGLIFYSADALWRWQPSNLLVYEANGYEKKTAGYITALDAASPGVTQQALAVYESVTAAAQIEGFDRHMISDAIKGNKTYQKRLWRKATEIEAGTMVRV